MSSDEWTVMNTDQCRNDRRGHHNRRTFDRLPLTRTCLQDKRPLDICLYDSHPKHAPSLPLKCHIPFAKVGWGVYPGRHVLGGGLSRGCVIIDRSILRATASVHIVWGTVFFYLLLTDSTEVCRATFSKLPTWNDFSSNSESAVPI